MTGVIRARLASGRLTEADPRGGAALRWSPTIAEARLIRPDLCPTDALAKGRSDLDLGACVFCHACAQDGAVAWAPGVPSPGTRRLPLVAGARAEELGPLRDRLAKLRGRFGRSLGVRLVSAGSCNGCEVEVAATTSPYVDLERFGVRFVASPRHADVLLVTGVVTRNLASALVRTVEATPEPRAVVAVGACGITGGIFAGSPHVLGGAASVVPVDVVVPGCPPPPEALLAGILEAGRILSARSATTGPP